jgi:hypothetical protein
MEKVLEMVKDLALQVVKSEFDKLPGNTPKEKEDAAVSWIIDRVESVDQLIPVIGQYLDLPIVDVVERWAIDKVAREGVRLLIRQQYAATKIEQVVNA